MASLDDLDAISTLDSQDVLGAVEGFAGQCRDAWTAGENARGLPDGSGVDAVVVLGMGGSGISGDVVGAVTEARLALPVRVLKSYGPLPEWLGRNTLVFAVSYSGNTEETLAAFEEAHARGARIVAISSGGALAERSREYGVAHVPVPAGFQPRASLGYLTVPILAVLQAVGIVSHAKEDLDDAVETLEDIARRCARSEPAPHNVAKDLANRLTGRVAVVYGGSGVATCAAQRFKCDLNEYGKVPAFWNYFPELNHNEIVGWSAGAVPADEWALVLLRDRDEHPRVTLRFEVTRNLIEPAFADVVEIRSEGTSPLARLLSLVMITQLAAIYVGLARDIDPGPVDVIEKLKSELARR